VLDLAVRIADGPEIRAEHIFGGVGEDAAPPGIDITGTPLVKYLLRRTGVPLVRAASLAGFAVVIVLCLAFSSTVAGFRVPGEAIDSSTDASGGPPAVSPRSSPSAGNRWSPNRPACRPSTAPRRPVCRIPCTSRRPAGSPRGNMGTPGSRRSRVVHPSYAWRQSNPYFSPRRVARPAKCGEMWRFRAEGRGVVLHSTSSTPMGENAADCGISRAAAAT
jgi:hypothetical protein